MLPPRPAQKRNSELSAALARCRHALIGIGVFTAAINLLQLTGPIFMLEVYDRVLPGRSVPTLVTISILALVMFGFQGLLDVLRARVLVRIAGLGRRDAEPSRLRSRQQAAAQGHHAALLPAGA